ncbi:IS3 family transposase [Exiguobacterium antarcticum]|uniref:IS3 family transposase n=1 Tax=Exiguobacterium antarcticum TaxID=132920 RepID=UPI003CE544C3
MKIYTKELKQAAVRDFQAYEELKTYIEAYIYFYNNGRFQKRLNGLSPIEFRTKAV